MIHFFIIFSWFYLMFLLLTVQLEYFFFTFTFWYFKLYIFFVFHRNLNFWSLKIMYFSQIYYRGLNIFKYSLCFFCCFKLFALFSSSTVFDDDGQKNTSTENSVMHFLVTGSEDNNKWKHFFFFSFHPHWLILLIWLHLIHWSQMQLRTKNICQYNVGMPVGSLTKDNM